MYALTILTASLLAGAQPEVVLAQGVRTDNYPNTELLVQAATLANADARAAYVLLDARSKEKFDKGHIPGAVWVDADSWAKEFVSMPDPRHWAKAIGSLGVSNKSKVVVYDDSKSLAASRVWWILKYWGAKDVRLLNGGMKAWGDRETVKAAAAPTSAKFEIAKAKSERLADAGAIRSILQTKKTQIVDSRSFGEFCGDSKLKNKRGGHLPGAVHLEWSDAIDPKTHKFRSAAELVALFEKAGVRLDQPVVTHCQTGGRAAVMVFTLELLGAKDVSNYYRGWSEWGNLPDTPIVTSPAKK